MKMFMSMLALVMGLSFGSATFVQADEMKKEAAPAAPASEMKKEEGKKAEKKAKKRGKKAKKEEAPKQ